MTTITLTDEQAEMLAVVVEHTILKIQADQSGDPQPELRADLGDIADLQEVLDQLPVPVDA